VSKGRKAPTRRETQALLRARGTVIRRADDLGEDELVDVMALFKINIARQASLQRERERLRAQTVRRFGRRGPHKAPRQLRRGTLYLIEDTSRER
jgi:hypothetical protein